MMIANVSDERYLLDTSAVLTFLEDEAGAQRVEEIIRAGRAVIPFLALLETYYISLQEATEAIAEKRYALLKQFPARFLYDVDEPTLLTAGRFKARHRLSLAGALIAAFAVREGAILVHKDPEFKSLSKQVKQETLPYK
jgi:predicted nucleic acid-binding protein